MLGKTSGIDSKMLKKDYSSRTIKKEKMGLKEKMQAALERANAGRKGKLEAKANMAATQYKERNLGNLKEGAKLSAKVEKLDMKSKKAGVRLEKRKMLNDMSQDKKRIKKSYK